MLTKTMRSLLALACFAIGLPAFAGGMYEIPVQLLDVDHQGRTEFLGNALAATGLAGDGTVRYKDFQSIVVGGDEHGSDFKGALFVYGVDLDSRANGYQRFHCSQFLSVGNFDPRYTRPIDCKKL